MSPPPSSLPPPPSPRLSDSAASEMTVLPTTPIRTAPPSPMNIMRTPSSPSTTIIYGTPASNLSIPTLHNDDSYYDDGDLLGLGELSMSHDDDTEPSTSDDISHSNNSYNTSNKDIILPPVTSEEDKIYENAKGFRPIIYSYLMKLGRNGKWQKRFFECDGGSLTYFKTEKRKKHLATLDLAKVGSIAISAEDKSGCTFHIQVADRPYSLMAESESVCVDWVITLNRVKEARMQIGRVKLVIPKLPVLQPAASMDEKDENYKLDEGNDACTAVRVVLEANRPRTRCADNSQWQEIMRSATSNTANSTVPGSQLSPVSSPARQFTKEAFDSIPLESRQNLAVWEKPSRLERIRDKILKWARSIKKAAINCRSSQAENIVFGEIIDNDNANAEQSSESPNPIPGVKESNIPRTSLKDEKSATLNNTNNSMNKPNLIPVDDDGETRHLT